MKVITEGFGTLEVEKVKYKPKGGLILPFVNNMAIPTCFCRVLSKGRYEGMIAIVHPGLVKPIEVPGLETYLIHIKDVEAFVQEEDGEEFYKEMKINPIKEEGSDWVHL